MLWANLCLPFLYWTSGFQNVALFEDRPFKKRIKMVVLGWALIEYDECPYKDLGRERNTRHTIMWTNGKKQACASPREASEEIRPADFLILIFTPPQLWENKLLFKPASLWYFVMVAPANWYRDSEERETCLLSCTLWYCCVWPHPNTCGAASPMNSVQSLSHIWLCIPQGLQHPRLPCPSPSPGVCSNSCPLSRWCHSTISSSISPSP